MVYILNICRKPLCFRSVTHMAILKIPLVFKLTSIIPKMYLITYLFFNLFLLKNCMFQNPCLKESKASMRCLMDTNGDKTKCQRFFDNYNECKTFWYEVTKSRRIAGISPSLPLLNDRQAFLKQYVQTGKIPITIENENPT